MVTDSVRSLRPLDSVVTLWRPSLQEGRLIMKMRSIASILSTAALLVTVACSDTVAAPDQIQTTPRVSAFVGALEQQGAKVIPMERLSPQA